jgi:glycosyltransferase involved in cell wall biosynthesis
MTKELPKISIVTPSFNQAEFLEATIQSVLSQNYPKLEYIIIDGGSTDGTLDIIQKYKDSISYFVSEPDKGIYDAMNKGVKKSKGDWIYFLGADDKLQNKKVLESIYGNNGLLKKKFFLIYGCVTYNTGEVFVSRLDSTIKLGNTVHHQAAFYNRTLFKDFSYNNQYNVYADYELNLIIYLRRYPSLGINQTIAKCSRQGISGKYRYSFMCHFQQALIKRRYFSLSEFIFYCLLSVKSYLRIKALQLTGKLS